MDAALAVRHRMGRHPIPGAGAYLPLDEQRRIADFLDDQVTRIDQIITRSAAADRTRTRASIAEINLNWMRSARDYGWTTMRRRLRNINRWSPLTATNASRRRRVEVSCQGWRESSGVPSGPEDKRFRTLVGARLQTLVVQPGDLVFTGAARAIL